MMDEKHLYFIALLLPTALSEEITDIKNNFSQEFNCKHALKLPPHITIQPPFRRESLFEGEMQSSLQKLFSIFEPFEVQLKGFGCFNRKNNKVIYIGVEENKALLEMHGKLMHYLKTELKFHEDEIQTSFHPHITIAHRDLSSEDFKKAWPEYKDKPFKAGFQTSSAYLMKHNGKTWEVQREFPFSKN